MKTDLELKEQVQDELRWEPTVNDTRVGVAVDHGAVALYGVVDCYAEKWTAEAAAKRVEGVRAVAQELVVDLSTFHARTDAEIAKAAHQILRWDVFVPNAVQASVERGAITLTGEVSFQFQRYSAARSLRHLAGVTDVFNRITLRGGLSTSAVALEIEGALQRQASDDAATIRVQMRGRVAILSGSASSWQAIDAAIDAAWAAPGVDDVIDRVALTPLLCNGALASAPCGQKMRTKPINGVGTVSAIEPLSCNRMTPCPAFSSWLSPPPCSA